MLLRLRQLTAHILMLQFVVRDLLEQEDIEKIREVIEHEATDQRSRKGEVIVAIRKQLNHLEAETKKRPGKQSTNGARNARPVPETARDVYDQDQYDIEELLDESQESIEHGGYSSGRRFGKTFDFRPYLESLTRGDNWEKVQRKASCSECGNRPRDAWLTSCGHLMCNRCYDEVMLRAAEEDKMHGTCNGCGSVFKHATVVAAVEDHVAAGPMTRAKTKHSREIQRIEEQDIAEDWLTYSHEGVLPSAKTIALKAQLMNWYVISFPAMELILTL